MAMISQRSKLVLKDLGNPDEIKSHPETVRRLVLGTLIGKADGFVQRANPKDGEIMEGLSGMFRSIPAKPDADQLESGVLFIPDAFHNLIASTLRKQQTDDPNATVDFAFEVASIRATNAQGRSWDFKPLIEQKADNPLDRLVSAIGGVKEVDGRRVLMIAAPVKEPETETSAAETVTHAAPAKTKAK